MLWCLSGPLAVPEVAAHGPRLAGRRAASALAPDRRLCGTAAAVSLCCSALRALPPTPRSDRANRPPRQGPGLRGRPLPPRFAGHERQRRQRSGSAYAYFPGCLRRQPPCAPGRSSDPVKSEIEASQNVLWRLDGEVACDGGSVTRRGAAQRSSAASRFTIRRRALRWPGGPKAGQLIYPLQVKARKGGRRGGLAPPYGWAISCFA